MAEKDSHEAFDPNSDETQHQRRSDLSRRSRLKLDEKAADIASTANPENNDLWISARSIYRSVLTRFQLGKTSQALQPIWKIEWDIHDLWYTFVRAATITPWDHPAQDRLAAEVILVRETGPLRSDEEPWVSEPWKTADGWVWSDLPYLVRDMGEFWQSNKHDLSPDQLRNLAAFIARLVALGARPSELCACALHAFRDALDEEKNEKDASGPSMSRIAQFLPAAQAWLQYAGHRLAALSLQEGSEGFSVENWTKWHQKFRAISQAHNHDENTRELARRGMNTMTLWSRNIGIPTEIGAVDRDGNVAVGQV